MRNLLLLSNVFVIIIILSDFAELFPFFEYFISLNSHYYKHHIETRRTAMKFFRDIKKNFKYSGQMLKLMWQLDKCSFFILFADIFVYSSMPFINLYLVRNSIAMLESRADFMKYLILVACSLVLYYCFNCLHDYFTMVRDTRYMKVQCDMFKNLFDKSLSLDYEMLLDKEV